MNIRRKLLQNRISESRWAPAVMSFFSISVWTMVCINDTFAIVPLLCMLFSTFLMMELNNTNALIRIFSRMVSCCYMALTTMATFQFVSIRAASVALCIVGSYICLFRCYQDKYSQGWVFYGFLCLGLSSIVWVQTLYYVPIVWILMRTRLQATSVRNYISSIFGILLPNIVALSVVLYQSEWQVVVRHFGELLTFGSFANYWLLSINQILTGVWIMLCAIIGTVHYLRKRRSDSIRTRMLYSFFVQINILSILFFMPATATFRCYSWYHYRINLTTYCSFLCIN